MVSFGLSKSARNLAVFLLGLIFLALVFEGFNHGALLPLFVIAMDNLWGWLEGTSPWLFFTAFIILPCLGLPISPFYLITTRILRAVVGKLISRTRFKIPTVRSRERVKLSGILRIIPEIPFFIQHCLLGLLGISLSGILHRLLAYSDGMGARISHPWQICFRRPPWAWGIRRRIDHRSGTVNEDHA